MSDYPSCDERGCGHPAEMHHLLPEDDFPPVLLSAPCSVEGCRCQDFDGMLHPERPSLMDMWISRDEDGGIIVSEDQP
jgi:hypothetical protein